MKAAIVEGQGRTPAYADFPAPVPGEGERLVRVTAAALTQLARGRASGAHYSASGAYPFVAGVDGVGRLDDGGRVYFLLPRAPYGAFAEETVVSAGQCLPVPDDLDDVTAAAIANPGMSSWAALVERAQARAGRNRARQRRDRRLRPACRADRQASGREKGDRDRPQSRSAGLARRRRRRRDHRLERRRRRARTELSRRLRRNGRRCARLSLGPQRRAVALGAPPKPGRNR